MEILLNNSSGMPIYQQIVNQVRGSILRRELLEGDPLPSMRQLAKDLRISLITTKRAYEELEAMGLVVTVGGKGCFVGVASPEKLAEEHRMELEQYLRKAAAAALTGAVSLEELLELTKLLYEEQEEGRGI